MHRKYLIVYEGPHTLTTILPIRKEYWKGLPGCLIEDHLVEKTYTTPLLESAPRLIKNIEEIMENETRKHESLVALQNIRDNIGDLTLEDLANLRAIVEQELKLS